MMEPNSALSLLEKNKVHHFLFLLPLITFILLKESIYLIVGYTILLAFLEAYFLFIGSFRKQASNVVLNPIKLDLERKKLGERLKELSKVFKEHLWFIPYPWLFCFVILSFLTGFIYSGYISLTLVENSEYIFYLFLAHVFFLPFITFLYLGYKHFAKVINKLKQEKEDEAK